MKQSGICFVSNKPVALEELSFQDVSFGQSPFSRRESPYRLEIDRARFIEAFSAEYQAWIADQRSDDARVPNPFPAYFKQLNYPPLRDFLAHPAEFEHFIRHLVPVEVLATCLAPLTSDNKLAAWVANSVDRVEITNTHITISGRAFEKDATPLQDPASGIPHDCRLPSLSPGILSTDGDSKHRDNEPNYDQSFRIVLKDSIPDGLAATGAAHASLAYHLRYRTMLAQENVQMLFASGSILRLPAAEFEKAKAIPGGVILTESALGGEAVSVVYRTKQLNEDSGTRVSTQATPGQTQAVKGESPTQGLKMYILVRDNLPFDAVLCACANASLQCFNRFESSPEMQTWVNGVFYKVVCRVSDKEFSNAQSASDCISIAADESGKEPIALAFKPRAEWPKMFRFFRLLR